MQAVILEPREHKALRFVVSCVLQVVKCPIKIFHGTKNVEFVRKIVDELKLEEPGSLGVSNLTREEYSAFLMSWDFWDSLTAEHILIFQTDSIPFLESPFKIEEFLKYDLIAAPWSNRDIGNGGFCLKRRSVCLEVIKRYWTTPELVKTKLHTGHEDVFFSTLFKQFGKLLPSFETAKTFSIESIFNQDAFGCHKCWGYLKKDQMAVLLGKHPELKELMRLNDVKEHPAPTLKKHKSKKKVKH